MKTIKTIVKEWEQKYYGEEYYMDSDLKPIYEVIKEYALQLVDEIMSAEHSANLYSGNSINVVPSEWIDKVKKKIR